MAYVVRMNEGQLKTKIFLMRAVDWLLFIAVMAFGVYSVAYAENPGIMIWLALFGLIIVSRFGDFLREKVALLNQILRNEWRRLHKR